MQAPNVTALTASSNATTATQQAGVPAQGNANSQPSVIIVEVLGYGGGGSDEQPPQRNPDEESQRSRTDNQIQDPRSRYQVVGVGATSEEDALRMAEEKRVQMGR